MRAVLSRLYDAVAWRRRRWYAERPDARRRLRQPVISVGALSVGGSGKTPVTAEVARILLAMGEQPAILSRGYARARPLDGVVVVRDHTRLVGDLATAGDEPWMLAQQLDGVAVVVATDRYLAGRLAETHLGATVHLLDDGFQHLGLARDVDLVVIGEGDLDDRVVPAGRLRERVSSVAAADAILLTGADVQERAAIAGRLGVPRSFGVAASLAPPVVRRPHPVPGPLDLETPVLAVAGIARPERFFHALRQAGCTLVETVVFPDHHRFAAADVDRLREAARVAGARAIVATEKDAVRLADWVPCDPPLAVAALSIRVDPADRFQTFLTDRLAAVRAIAA